MSEGKWNHPMFEKIRNAEVEAPEFIMDAAIKRSNKNSFFYFQWHSLNIWYLALGLSIGLSVLLFNTNQNQGKDQLFSKVQKEQPKQKADLNGVSSMESKVVPTNVEQTNSKRSPIAVNQGFEKHTPAVHQDGGMNTNVISVNAVSSSEHDIVGVLSETQADSLQRSLAPNISVETEKQIVEPHLELPKKGRPLKVKIGENAKP